MISPQGAVGVVTTEPRFGAVNGVGQVVEIGRVGSGFARMLEDLKGSTVRLEDPHVGDSLESARLLVEMRETAARPGSALRDLQTAQQRLVEGETLRAMGQMASGVAHHLNNLLAVSSGRIQLLLLRATDAEGPRQPGIARDAMEDDGVFRVSLPVRQGEDDVTAGLSLPS